MQRRLPPALLPAILVVVCGALSCAVKADDAAPGVEAQADRAWSSTAQ